MPETTTVIKRPKKKMSRALMSGILLLLLVLGIALGVQGAETYRNGMMERYRVYLESMLRLTATRIDADDLRTCMETGVKSEKYMQAQEFLDAMKNNCDLKYVYVVKPLNTEPADNMMNVIAGVSDEERVIYADILVQLNELTGTEYSPEVARTYLERMDRSDEITYYSNTTEFGYMYTGLMPLHDSNGDPVAILSIDIAMNEIAQTLGRYHIVTAASVLFLALLSLVFAYVWLHFRIIQPIVKMERAYSGFVESSRNTNDPDELVYEKPGIHTQDEMQALSETLSAMSEDMKRYMKTLVKETAEKERIGAELDMASSIQSNVLPNVFPAFPERKEFSLYASMDPAKEVGGDFYDFYLIDDDHLALVVADVSGKGVPAALFMMTSRTLLKEAGLAGLDPASAMFRVNERLLESDNDDMFVTVWMGILEISTGKLTYADAGHEKPLVYQDGAWRFLPKGGCTALAVIEPDEFDDLPPHCRFSNKTIQLKPGDLIFQYTDGVTEATNAEPELFGDDRLLSAVNEAGGVEPEKLLPFIRDRIDGFVKDAPQFDDLTMLALKYYGPRP